jgi:hypothetical protein
MLRLHLDGSGSIADETEHTGPHLYRLRMALLASEVLICSIGQLQPDGWGHLLS